MSNLSPTSIVLLPPNKICILVLCGILTFIAACDNIGRKNYFPLADGAKWEYIGLSSLGNGKQIRFLATIRVEGETLINGKRYFKYIISSDFSRVTEDSKERESVRYYRVTDDGIYFRLGSDIDKPELLEMPLPILIDTKWLSGSTEAQAKSVGTITIGGREYRDCLKITYKQQGIARSLENYLAPDVGIIKVIDVNTTDPKTSMELTLEKYEP
jgi:hypothetical protein